MKTRSCLLAVIVALACSCVGRLAVGQAAGEGEKKTMVLKSSTFEEGGMIPKKHTADGPDVSPPLAWTGAPAGVKSFALICDDPDAPGGAWVHWVIYGIPATATELPEAVPQKANLDDGSLQGKNDFEKTGYNGPSPPRGTHRYYFKLYALDAAPALQAGATKEQLLKTMQGHVLAEAQVMGKYARK